MSAFLTNEPAYNRYLEGGLNLPTYNTDQNGNIVLIAGEVFCRVDSYTSKDAKFSTSGNLRNYLKTHPTISLPPTSRASRYTNSPQ
ncbi:hypothetical protein PENARI_c100G07097 [Penicillium arizonense]|uniref:Uncharacterized protein n=1 Tax=Penicillium arizonense TaxID=1835702 RepID=A0A1F5L0U1_PENAI|nr:hypothetical protein PENARI_c100G07097 [Penicillium arizonense]OGE46843.1 hypothetical protein PENARI_c100G07097 [Penicillium arizonense]